MAFIDGLLSRKGAPATLFASDAQSNPQSISAYVSNTKQVQLLGTNRGDVLVGYLPTTVPVSQGQVLAVPSLPAVWYVVVKILQHTQGVQFARATTVALLALPSTLSVTRTVLATGGKRNGYGERRTSADQTVTTRTIRAGISNDNRPLITADTGNQPRSVTTLYCPLGSDVQLGDRLTLPDGRSVTVQQRNLLDANGASFALQLLADQV